MTQTHQSLDRAQNHIHALIDAMATLVDSAVAHSLHCLDHPAPQVAAPDDASINALQREIEQHVLNAIARFQPMASDLRDLYSGVHVAAELERIGDYAARSSGLLGGLGVPVASDIASALRHMGSEASAMLRSVVAAFIAADEATARAAAEGDKEIDRLEQQLITQVLADVRSQSTEIEVGMKLIWIAHYIERIADRATNIAERTVLRASGSIVRLN